MNDVFDEDLMKELGLDPSDLKPEPDVAPASQTPAKPMPGHKDPLSESMSGAKASPPAPRVSASPQPKKPAPAVAQKPGVEQSQKVEFKPQAPKHEVVQPAIASDNQAMKMAHDIPVQLAAVLAKKAFRLNEVLAIGVGEVITFDKLPQDPIDLVANGKLVAKAELVVVDGKLGARILKLVR